MTITLGLRPEVEKVLHPQLIAHGVSCADYLQEIVSREAALVDACAKVRGLLTEEEVAKLFSRRPSSAV